MKPNMTKNIDCIIKGKEMECTLNPSGAVVKNVELIVSDKERDLPSSKIDSLELDLPGNQLRIFFSNKNGAPCHVETNMAETKNSIDCTTALR